MAEALEMTHGLCHLYDGLIGSLRHPVLLRHTRWRGLPCNAVFAQKIIKRLWNKFPTIVRPKNLHYLLRLPLHHIFPFIKACQHLVFRLKHIHQNLVWEIVNECEKIPCASNEHCFHQPVYVGMHELQDRGAGSSIGREWSPHLFAYTFKRVFKASALWASACSVTLALAKQICLGRRVCSHLEMHKALQEVLCGSGIHFHLHVKLFA